MNINFVSFWSQHFLEYISSVRDVKQKELFINKLELSCAKLGKAKATY